MAHDTRSPRKPQAPSVDAWDCPCGTRNLSNSLKCYRCLRPSTDARVRLLNQQGMVRDLASQQSFKVASIAVLLLYGAGFVPGLLANRFYLEEGECAEELAGRGLPGVHRLRQLWLTGRPLFALLHAAALLLVGMTLWGFQSQRPVLVEPPRPAFSRPTVSRYRAWSRAPRAHVRRPAPAWQGRPVATRPSLPTYSLPAPQPSVVVWTPTPAADRELHAPPAEAPSEPRWTRQRAAVWVAPRVVPDVSGSLDPPVPEQAPEPIARPRAPIQLYGMRGRRQTFITPPPLRPLQETPLNWKPETRFPGFRR